MTTIQNVMVIGAGQMGSGIAHVAAEAGMRTTLYDLNTKAAQQGLATIKRNLARSVEKGRQSAEQAAQLLERITLSDDINDAQAADLVIEAVVERMDVKAELFRQLDTICPPHTILASNTSSLPITELAAETERPEKVIGMHFMNPVPVMRLVEVIRGLRTSDETVEAVEQLALQMNKTAVEVNDFPGFVSNRVLMPMINEAVYCVHEGVATAEAIDQVMTLGMNHPMGPLALADLIGLDTCLYIMETLHHGLGDSKYRPCPLLRNYVKAGWLGRKAGRGFYSYE
ncbi:3-hydroxybutyryl-CoA dehydrogenase [Ammoniphilus oxalaticus]|uniref:3-hydroxybutyryl-CoA dehydrogenase n=1 Tax=Ammoniphilus oxalaticus TaxID=66863 RepID=A0A419SHM3_9BACL|nr:3-hydroxybutyryl-CoA dehydrogenase [Ammoniphilus oxalaticus]RKD23235.1 3-hydroxybutyryl-CoA dehydrogenase [Ammoniphilus oxalaticus]